MAVDTIHEHLLHDGKGDTRIDISEKKHTFRGHRLRGIKVFFLYLEHSWNKLLIIPNEVG